VGNRGGADFYGVAYGFGDLRGDELMKTLAPMGGSLRNKDLPQSEIVCARTGMILSGPAFFKGAKNAHS
jgi:hypothetical protein